MRDYGRQIAYNSLLIGSIVLSPAQPFVWASGYSMPIYNDNRMNLTHTENRRLIVKGFLESLKELDYDFIAGTSTAGISWAAIVADRFEDPFIYIRDKPKDHGMKNRIEGLDSKQNLASHRVVLIEDLVSTGGSSVDAVQAIRDAQGEIEHALCIFDYELEPAREMFAGSRDYKDEKRLHKPCELHSLLKYSMLLQVARDENYISKDEAKILEAWREAPFEWGDRHGFPRRG